VFNGRANGGAVANREPVHDGVLPLFGALAEQKAGHDGSDENGENECADEGEGDGPGHGLEQPAFNGFQREDGQVGGDDDGAGEEDGALDLNGSLANFLGRGAGVVLIGQVADHVLNHDD
jgi:hypothetical protein